MLDQMEKGLLQEIAGISGFMPGSAFNLRANGMGVERHSTANIQIRQKSDKPALTSSSRRARPGSKCISRSS